MYRTVLPLGLALLALAGCGTPQGPRTVTGQVTLDGKPLAGAHVEFVPKEDLTLGSFGAQTDEEGRFTARLGGPGKVARAGRFVVLVTRDVAIGAPVPPSDDSEEARTKALMGKTAPGARGTLPALYADRETSPFQVEIKDGTTELETFELSSKPAKR